MKDKRPAIVHIVDDDQEVHAAIAELVDSVGLVAQGYASAERFLSAYDPAIPGCLVSDVCMPGMGGLQLQQTLVERGLSIPIIMLTGHADVPMAVEVLSRGAESFLQKPFRTHEFVELIKKAIKKDRENRRREQYRVELAERFARLTARESEVVNLVVSGAQNKQIARRLNISERTVEAHRARCMEKLAVESLAQLVAFVLKYREMHESCDSVCNVDSAGISP